MELNHSMSIFSLTSADRPRTTVENGLAEASGTNSDAFLHLLGNYSERAQIPQLPDSQPIQERSDAFLTNLWSSTNAIQVQIPKLVPAVAAPTTAPAVFVASILPSAQLAARQLGTSVAAVIAVAAHETGWGKHIIKTGEESSSNNLFGIKSTRGSPENSVRAKTFEFIDGRKERKDENFRVYANTEDSIADFAVFLQSNQRYSKALSQANNAAKFIDEIHRAGYATDPDYSTKVKLVMTQVEEILSSNVATLPKK